jgi:hypothetical protein
MDWSVAAMVFAMAACGFPRPADVVGDAGASDADGDAAEGATMTFGAFVQIVFPAAVVPTMPLSWSSAIDVDTDTSSMCNAHHNKIGEYCVVAATDITLAVGATLRAHGSKPIVCSRRRWPIYRA